MVSAQVEKELTDQLNTLKKKLDALTILTNGLLKPRANVFKTLNRDIQAEKADISAVVKISEPFDASPFEHVTFIVGHDTVDAATAANITVQGLVNGIWVDMESFIWNGADVSARFFTGALFPMRIRDNSNHSDAGKFMVIARP
jgi:hypothetical protein